VTALYPSISFQIIFLHNQPCESARLKLFENIQNCQVIVGVAKGWRTSAFFVSGIAFGCGGLRDNRLFIGHDKPARFEETVRCGPERSTIQYEQGTKGWLATKRSEGFCVSGRCKNRYGMDETCGTPNSIGRYKRVCKFGGTTT